MENIAADSFHMFHWTESPAKCSQAAARHRTLQNGAIAHEGFSAEQMEVKKEARLADASLALVPQFPHFKTKLMA
jgi:hypothetical protein